VGRDSEAWEKILGKHGLGNENSNGTRILSLCAVHQLSITNTLFQQKNRRKTSWRHLRSGHWHLIDYIIVRQRDVSDVCLTRSFRGPTCWSDQCLIRSKLSIHISVKHRHTRKSLKRLNTKALCGTDTQAMLHIELSEALCTATHPVADNVDDEWTFVRDSTYRAAANTLGFVMSIETGLTRTISQPPSSWTSSITNTWLGLMIETRLIRKHHTSKHGKWSSVNCAL